MFPHGKSVLQIRSGFSLLSEVPSLRLELDGYTILEGSSLDLFRDGDIVTVKASQAALPLGQTAGSKRHRSEDSVPAFTAGKWARAIPDMLHWCVARRWLGAAGRIRAGGCREACLYA